MNDAYLDSLEYLNRKGLPYVITNVNYSYTHSNKSQTYDGNLLGGGFNDYNFEFFDQSANGDLFGLVD